MYINFWYVAEESKNVTDKPVKVEMLGQEFALFRDSKGDVQCISNTCTHRGASMANGKIKGDCLECPYHGWTFEGDGTCVRLPSLGPDAKIPKRANIDAYPVQEKYGFIHVFLGDLPEEERPPIMEVAEWDQEGWRVIPLIMEWDIDYKRSIENTLDPAHNEFTHDTHGFSGENSDYFVHEVNLEERDWGTGFVNPMFAPPLPQEDMREASNKSEDGVAYAGSGNHGPHCTWTTIHPSEDAKMHGYAFHTPVNEKKDKIFGLFFRNFLLDPKNDDMIEHRSLYVAKQDQDVLEPINPMRTPRNNLHEVLVPADKAIARYREWCREWEAKGWRIDVKEMRATEDDTAYVIPSPARRESKNFAIKTVPLISGEGPSAKLAAE